MDQFCQISFLQETSVQYLFLSCQGSHWILCASLVSRSLVGYCGTVWFALPSLFSDSGPVCRSLTFWFLIYTTVLQLFSILFGSFYFAALRIELRQCWTWETYSELFFSFLFFCGTYQVSMSRLWSTRTSASLFGMWEVRIRYNHNSVVPTSNDSRFRRQLFLGRETT
jgi:hypothetical protein